MSGSSLAYFVLAAAFSYLAYVSADPDPSIDAQPSCRSGKLDLVLVVDVSSGISRRFNANRNAAFELVRPLSINWQYGVVVSVIQYSRSSFAALEFGKDQTLQMVNDSIAKIDWTGGVAYSSEAMDLAMIQFRQSRPDAVRVIVLFSEGNSMSTWEDVQATADRLKYSRARIFAVTMFGKPNEADLLAYIGNSNGSIITNQTGLIDLERQLLEISTSTCPPSQAIPDAKPSETGPSANANPPRQDIPDAKPSETAPDANVKAAEMPDMKGGPVQNHLKKGDMASAEDQMIMANGTAANATTIAPSTDIVRDKKKTIQ